MILTPRRKIPDDPADPKAPDPVDVLLPFRGRHRRGAELPLQMLKQQDCILCQRHGCAVRPITPLDQGGTLTGDNLLPVCPSHASHSLDALYAKHPRQMRTWLIEHERIDVVLKLHARIIIAKHES